MRRDVEYRVANLLEDLHGQLGSNRTTGNKFVQGVGQSHSDSVKLAELWEKKTVLCGHLTYDEPL